MNKDKTPVKDVKDLKPIIEETIRKIYGEEITELKMIGARLFPLGKDVKQWMVGVSFRDKEFYQGVSMGVDASDGTVVSIERFFQHPIP